MPPAGAIHVLVHDRLEAETALAVAAETGAEITLVMAAGMAGPAFVQALESLLGRPILTLCDDRPGLALAALRAGLRWLVLERGPEQAAVEAAARLADIAGQLGGELQLAAPAPLHVVCPRKRRFVPVAAASLGLAPSLVP